MNGNRMSGFRGMAAIATILTFALAIFVTSSAVAQNQKKQQAERILQLDRNGDGLLAKDEISKPLWERVAKHDLDGDEKLNAKEQEAAGLSVAKGKAGMNPGGAPASFSVHSFTGTNKSTVRYSLFVPATRKDNEKFPVVLCLHGRGGNTDAASVISRPAMQAKHPCIVIAPGIDGAKERWAPSARDTARHRVVTPELVEMLDAVIDKHAGNAARVYVTGQSMGGVGSWGLIAAHADRFAAAVPVCGIWNVDDAAKMKSVPVWAFHGADDPTVPVAGSRDMINALKAAGAEPKYTEYPGVGHGSWTQAYATSEMWSWMFSQKRAAK